MLPTLTDQLFACIHVGLGALVGAVLGWERERKNRPAGFRTHIAVGMASALIMRLADLMVNSYPTGTGLQIDPTRVLEAVVGGVTFLGAGTIITHRGSEQVQGLTTAAGLLVTAALGVAAGLGAYLLAFVGTAGMLAVLILANRMGPSPEPTRTDG